MTTIATLAVRLIGDIREYNKSMTDAEKQAQKTANTIGKNLQDVGQSISSVGQKATLGLTLPIVALGATAISAASSLEETRNKANVVFGDMSQTVLDWSKTSATAFGQSQQQALDAAATYGNLFTALGVGQKPAADMSMSLVQLASDLASFNDADPSEVLLALRSGLSGEVEPLKKFGVAMNEATLKAKAMELGMGDNLQALTEAQKLQLRYALIMQQTTVAQGDFARTADGLANSQRTLKAQFTDAAAALGTQLLPLALKFVTFLTALIEKFAHLPPGMQKFIVIVLAVVAAVGPLLMVIGSIVSGVGALIPLLTSLAPVLGTIGAVITGTVIPAIASFLAAIAPVILPILAIIAVVTLLYFAWKNNWLGIRDVTAAALAWLQNAFANGVTFIKNIWQSLQPAIQYVLTIIRTIAAAWQAAFNGDWYRFGQLLRQAWDMIWKLITTVVQTAWQNIRNTVSNGIKNVISFFRDMDWAELGRNIIRGIAGGIRDGIGWIIDAARDAAQAALDAAQGFLGIHSESKVFHAQVGYQMAAGTAGGFREGLAKLLQPNLGLLTPSFAASTPTVPGVSGGGSSVGNNNQRIIELLEQIANKQGIDESTLARNIRDAVMQAGTRR